jgi:pilus assembly protein CpaE
VLTPTVSPTDTTGDRGRAVTIAIRFLGLKREECPGVNPINVCVHHLKDTEFASLQDAVVVCRSNNRDELRNALRSLNVAVLILDLDAADAIPTIIEVLEIQPKLGVVGVTGRTDLQHAIAAQRAGCRQITSKPVDPNDLSVAIRRALHLPTGEGVESQTIAVLGATGGAGATTIACYLAVAISERSRAPTAIIDLDLDFGGVARAWDLAPRHTIADLAAAGTVDSVLLEKAAVRLPSGVNVIARPASIEQGQTIEDTTIGDIIRVANGVYPFLVLDLPRKLDSAVGRAIEHCDKLLVVLQLTVPSVDNGIRLIDALMRFGVPGDRIEVVVNRFRKNVHSVSVELIEKQLRRRVFAVVPNDYRAIMAAFDLGEPVPADNPVRTAITELTVKLLGESAAPPPPSGWLSRLGLGLLRKGVQRV